MTAIIDAKDFATHNNRQSCWLAIHGTVWDATDFVESHPGGAATLLKVAGKDATEAYDEIHNAELVEETLGKRAKRGTINTATIPMPESAKNAVPNQQDGSPSLRSMINLNDFEAMAQKAMTPRAWAYVSSGADDEISRDYNGRIYQRVMLRPRILRRVGEVSTATKILGQESSLPVYTSPVGLAKLVHPDGECAIARAAGKEGVVQIVNTVSSMPIEAIMDARTSVNQPVFWQLYVDKNLDKSTAFIKRVEKAGVQAIVWTVDSPVVGKRERDERDERERDERERGVDERERGVEIGETFSEVVETSSTSGIAKASTGFIDPDIDWSSIAWLRSTTNLPIVVKGIQSVEDAVTADDHKVDGIVLSNHGGRSQDTAQPPLLTLLEINHYAPRLVARDSRMQIFVDGGVRRGTDVLKALCLGATAVGVGRPVLYSMSGGYGEYGVRRMIQILRNELQTNMAYLGATNVHELETGMLNTRRLEKLVVGSTKL